MKTAVQLLLEHLNKYDIQLYKSVEEELLETEKQQIIDDYSEGMGHYGDDNSRSEADKYYTSTFETNKL